MQAKMRLPFSLYWAKGPCCFEYNDPLAEPQGAQEWVGLPSYQTRLSFLENGMEGKRE